MPKSCTVNPRIKRADGQVVESTLFKALRNELDYKTATELYLRTKNPQFNALYGDSDKLQLDANGEPTLDSLKKMSEFQDVFTYDYRRSAEEKKVKADESKEATRENIEAADKRAIAYNNAASASGEFVASTEFFTDEDGIEKVRTVILPNTKENRESAAELSRKLNLNRKLRDLLSKLGVSVGTLNELEQKMRIAGVTDFQAAQLTADGMVEIIRIAKGIAGEEALPEEFSHLVLEALQDNAVVQRLHNAIRDHNLAPIILGEDYDRYVSEYNNDSEMLVNEAMGTLVAKHILAQVGITTETTEGYANIKNLVSRMRSAFDDKFSQQDENEYLQALQEAEQVAGEFADAILNSNLYQSIDTKSIRSDRKYYQVKEEVDKKEKLLKELCDNTARRYAILESRAKSTDRLQAEVRMQTLLEQYARQEYEAGVYTFLSDALKELEEVDTRLEEITKHPETSFNSRAKQLRRTKDFIQSYRAGISSIINAVTLDEIKLPEEQQAVLDKVNKLVGRLALNYENITQEYFKEFIKMFIGDGIEIPYGKMKGHKITAEELAGEDGQYPIRDIGMMDRWLDSMANSGDAVLRMMDSTVKGAKGKARLQTLRIKERIDEAWRIAQKAGIKDTKFMYHIDPNTGKRTFQYANRDDRSRMSLAQQNYYDAVMGIKKELDAMLPDGTTSTLNVIRIRKDLIDRLLNNKTSKGTVAQIIDSLKDAFHRTSEDTEYGGQQSEGSKSEEKRNVLMDFEGREVERLPIYYINSREGENPENLSDDMNNTLLAYAQMATNYFQMNEVIGTLELLRDKMRTRKVQQTRGNRLVRSVYTAFGVRREEPLTTEGEATNIVQRMNDWFSSQVYGKYMKDEGEFLGMDKGKLANSINAVTALNTFALNILSGISNVATGTAMMRIESISGQFLNLKDTTKADAIFTKEMPAYLGDVGSPIKSSKLALFDELFNVMQEFESDTLDARYTRSRARNLCSSNALYLINNAGELWMQNRTALALANAYKLKTAEGNQISLWDALEVDRSGEVPKLKVKDGVTKEDGTKFDDSDIIAFTNRAKGINQRMHGIYNYEDRNAFQATAIGKMCLMFRKWIRPNLQLKYGKMRYNYDLQDWEEGYWRTFGNFMLQSWHDLKAGQLHIMAQWNRMTPIEKANIRRWFMEMAQYLLAIGAFALLNGLATDDDDTDFENTWAFQQLRYQARRLQTELGATQFGPQMFREGLTILKSPAAGINTLESGLNTLRLVNPLAVGEAVGHTISGNEWDENTRNIYGKRMQSGKFKGRTKAHKIFMESPFVPIWKTIYRGTHPKESLPFFTQND